MSEQQKRQILSAYDGGWNYRKIARVVEVTEREVRAVLAEYGRISPDHGQHAEDAIEEFADPGEARIAALRRVLEGKQYAKIDGQMVDSFTASAIVQVYDTLNDANKAKYRAMTVPKMASVAWKFVKNPARRIARAGVPAGRYLSRPSQITRRAPTKRLAKRRRANLRAGREGFFPNPPRRRVKIMRKNPVREIVTITGKRSGRVLGYATLDTSRAELGKAALLLANEHLEPVTIERKKLSARGLPENVQAYINNPAPRSSEAISRAARRFSRFTGHKAERVEMLPFPRRPKAGLAVGPVLMLGYIATRDGKRENYLHKFAPHARPMLVASEDGKALYLIGGRYTFTERGIVDKRK